MALNKLPIGMPALPDDMDTEGNDGQLKTLMASVRNKHKANRWGDYEYTFVVRRLNQDGSGDDDSRMISGKSLSGAIVRNVTVYLRKASSASTVTTNFVTATMYKNSSRDYSETDVGRPQESDAVIVEEQEIRSIQGVDDDLNGTLLDSAFIELPVTLDWIGPNEFWSLRFTPPSTTTFGWDEAHVTIRFSELHIT